MDEYNDLLTQKKLEYDARIAGSYLGGSFENDNFDLPLSGGNLVSIQAYLDLYRSNNYRLYFWFLIYARYFTNLYSIEGNEDFKKCWKAYMYTSFYYGCGAIVRENGKFKAYGLIVKNLDENQDITAGRVWVNNISFLGTHHGIIGNTVEIEDSRVCFGKFNFQGVPAIWFFLPFCKDIVNLLKSYRANFFANTKKIIYKQQNNNSATIDYELSRYFDLGNPIIYNKAVGDSAEISNKFEELKFTNSNNELLEQVKKYMGLMYIHLGIDYNDSVKAERNITAEFEAQKLMVHLQQKEYKDELEAFITRCNEKWPDINVKLVDEKEVQQDKADNMNKTLNDNNQGNEIDRDNNE